MEMREGKLVEKVLAASFFFLLVCFFVCLFALTRKELNSSLFFSSWRHLRVLFFSGGFEVEREKEN